ncbi:hypothetical protein AXF42_Ash018384 [Apostasia shenzhenica]|uniref:Uncharacterized protein n=1 Tax=Apostasia shenzhenica TaxID=1088818 RepID=A0A2I0BE63_9ASPA|nr:hypothetical protein AXF42_Ash018384 [Apostasia shenzhenica]
MRREGRQHGLVLTHVVVAQPINGKGRPISRVFSPAESPLTAGPFARAQRKPTNHSKFTGRCRHPRCVNCHLHPVTKSKGKSKGTHKHRDEISSIFLKGDLYCSDEEGEPVSFVDDDDDDDDGSGGGGGGLPRAGGAGLAAVDCCESDRRDYCRGDEKEEEEDGGWVLVL